MNMKCVYMHVCTQTNKTEIWEVHTDSGEINIFRQYVYKWKNQILKVSLCFQMFSGFIGSHYVSN